MSKNVMIIVGALLLIGAAIMIFFALNPPVVKISGVGNDNGNSQGNNNNSGGNNTNSGGGPGSAGNNGTRIDNMEKSSIDQLAKTFKEAFDAWLWNPCDAIASVNQLTANQLAYFNQSYIAMYGISPYQTMENASEWCWYSDAHDYPLFEKLKALNPTYLPGSTTGIPIMPNYPTLPPLASTGMTNGMKNSDIEFLAKTFNEKFAAYGAARCNIIDAVNTLDSVQLTYFVTYYKAKFGVTAKKTMDTGWIWCAYNNNDTALYAKLK